MIEYELAGNDLGEVRFAISPLNELVLSLRTLRDPGRFPLQLPWLRATGPTRAGLDLELLGALTNESLWTPDFLTPRPYTPLGRIDDELAALTGTPAGVVRADLAEIHPAMLPPVLRGRPDKVLDQRAWARRLVGDPVDVLGLLIWVAGPRARPRGRTD